MPRIISAATQPKRDRDTVPNDLSPAKLPRPSSLRPSSLFLGPAEELKTAVELHTDVASSDVASSCHTDVASSWHGSSPEPVGFSPSPFDNLQSLLGAVLAEEPGEQSCFAKQLAREGVNEVTLPGLIADLRHSVCDQLCEGNPTAYRAASLLFVHAARGSRACRAALVAEGSQMIGCVLKKSVALLERGTADEKYEAQMCALACISCLRRLPVGRATMWEHRRSLGRPFFQLHEWCGRLRSTSAVTADLREATSELCKRWQRQPKPASQESQPEQKALRTKVVTLVAQGLAGNVLGSKGESASADSTPQLGAHLSAETAAAEVEAALFSRHGGATHEYRQHSRMLRSNLVLPGNGALRKRVLSLEVSAEELVAKDSAELAPETLQEERLAQRAMAFTSTLVTGKLVAPEIADRDERRFGCEVQGESTAPLFVSLNSVLTTQGTVAAALVPTPLEQGLVSNPTSIHRSGDKREHLNDLPASATAINTDAALMRFLSRSVFASPAPASVGSVASV